jgi:ABC-type antimicrobial peptide transport system permease subunit
MEKEYPAPQFNHYLSNLEENYDLLLKSENTLLKLLTILSLVCIIICVFGFVSLVSLTCEERRKEIAIRKINGATIKDILDIFFKEYIALLVIGAVIAFPAGYLIMKRWLEDYVVQTPINAWVYAVILLALIMSIILCVGWKVYKTSTENPAEVVKS